MKFVNAILASGWASSFSFTLQDAQADDGAGVWNYQSGDRISAIQAAGAGEGLARMDVGVRKLQPQADVHAHKSGPSGVKSSQSGPASRKNVRNHRPERMEAVVD